MQRKLKNPFPEENKVGCPPHPDPRSSSRGEPILSSGLYFQRPARGLAHHWSPVRAAASTWCSVPSISARQYPPTPSFSFRKQETLSHSLPTTIAKQTNPLALQKLFTPSYQLLWMCAIALGNSITLSTGSLRPVVIFYCEWSLPFKSRQFW